MRLPDVIRLSLHNVYRARFRTLLTIFSIAIGVASVVLVLSLGDGSRSAIADQLDKIGLEGIMIYPKQTAIAQGISLQVDDALDLYRNVDGVDKAMPVLIRYGSYKLKNWQGNALIYGVDSTMRDILKTDLLYGRLPNRMDIEASKPVAVVNSDFAEMIYKRKNIVGKRIKLIIGSYGMEFEVIGVISTRDDGLSQLLGEALPEFIYIPYSAAMELSREKSLDEIIIKSTDDKVGQRAVSYLNRKYGNGLYFKFENINGIRDRIDNVISLIALFIGSIAAISIVVAGFGIMNTMMSATVERKREIGIYLTLGATGRDILFSFLAESAIVSAIGGVLGILLAIIPIIFATNITNIEFKLNAGYILIAETTAVLCGIVFAVGPASKAAAMNPIDAIRSE
jgi:putative ABC transport system permease protein